MNWTHIIVHHSATIDSGTFSWAAIRKYHIEIKNWRDIGYHAGIELIGNEYIVMTGRPLNVKGAHCEGFNMNNKALGFCFVGNYDKAIPPAEMLIKGAAHIKGWMDILGIPTDNVRGHRDYSSKSCPGKKFDMVILRGLLG